MVIQMTDDEIIIESVPITIKRITIDPQILWELTHGWDEFQEENK